MFIYFSVLLVMIVLTSSQKNLDHDTQFTPDLRIEPFPPLLLHRVMTDTDYVHKLTQKNLHGYLESQSIRYLKT